MTAPAKELVGEESKHNQKQKVAPSTALRVVAAKSPRSKQRKTNVSLETKRQKDRQAHRHTDAHRQSSKVMGSLVRVVMVVVAMARAVVACGLQRVLNTTAAGENVWVLGVIVTFTSHVGAPQLDRVVQLCAALPLHRGKATRIARTRAQCKCSSQDKLPKDYATKHSPKSHTSTHTHLDIHAIRAHVAALHDSRLQI